MTDTLANILHHFPGPVNHVRCLAHVVNLVARIILHQFDASKRPVKDDDKYDSNINNLSPDKLDEVELVELIKHAEKEEKEMDEGDDEDSGPLKEDLEEIEAAMSEEVERARTLTQPVCCVLYKVSGCQRNATSC
jgi:hypothetical protein